MKKKSFLLGTASTLLSIVLLLTWGLAMPGKVDSSSSSTGILELVAYNPERIHRFAPGATTTYVLKVKNTSPGAASALLRVKSVSLGWKATLSEGDISFQPVGEGGAAIEFPEISSGSEKWLVVSMVPTASMPVGYIGQATISAELSSGPTGTAALQAIVSDRPKVYILSIDGLGPRYVMLGRDGNENPAAAERLMPNVSEFLDESAWFTRARSSLPSSTDMNMYALYSGSWPGTAGIPYVTTFMRGWDSEGREIMNGITPDDLRFGADGQPVLSLFDVAKDPAYGGDPDTYTALISGKFQVDNMFRTVAGWSSNIDVLTDGQWFPYYMTPPTAYTLGDPITDQDAATDRDGINVFPSGEYRMHAFGYGLAGANPIFNPSDRWVAKNAMRILAAEDPDIFAIHLGNVDKIQHGAGVADRPQEWVDPGTPDILWDDVNLYNVNANREPVLDVVHEADACIGDILDVLENRGVKDRSLIVLASDHSAVTYLNEDLNLNGLLTAGGLAPKVRYLNTYGETGMIYLHDPNDADLLEAALEGYSRYNCVLEREVNPFIAITRDEMLSGVDGALGRFGRSGGPWRGEMYSEWLIEHLVDDNSKVVWPDIFVYTVYRYQVRNTTTLPRLIGGHAGPTAMPVLFAVGGAPFLPGTYQVEDVSLVDAVPTIYHQLGLTPPANVDGRVLEEVMVEP